MFSFVALNANKNASLKLSMVFAVHSRLFFTESHIGTRNSSGDEIANMNFLYDDIVHVLQNTIDLCINSATVMCWNACVYQIQ